jgi:hypothetical protein
MSGKDMVLLNDVKTVVVVRTHITVNKYLLNLLPTTIYLMS